MPIRPENRARYPKDWKQVRERILARADNRCEWCKAANRERIARGCGSDAGFYMTDDANVWCAETGQCFGQRHMSDFEVGRMVDVVLTIAHLDHVPENCSDDNLRALCQRCHLTYDAKHHAETARATRHAKRIAVGDLFGAEA